MDKTLISLGAALVAAGISAVPKARAAATLTAAGLVPLAAGIIANARKAAQERLTHPQRHTDVGR